MRNDVLMRRLRDDVWFGMGAALGFYVGGGVWYDALAFGFAVGMGCAVISQVVTAAM